MNFYNEAIESKQSYFTQLSRQQNSLRRLIKDGVIKDVEGNVDLAHLYDAEIDGLRGADAYYWDGRITQMVIASGQQMPSSITFDDSWVLGQAGFWWFGRSSPLIGLSTDDKKYYVSAVSWRVESGGLHINSLTLDNGKLESIGALTWLSGETVEDANNRLALSDSRSAARLRPDLGLSEVMREKIQEVAEKVKDKLECTRKLVAVHRELERLGETPKRESPDLLAEMKQLIDSQKLASEYNTTQEQRICQWKEASANALLTFACGSLWLQQKIVVTEPAVLERAARRRLERAGVFSKCLVVQLRRKEYVKTSGDDHEPVDWAWQWAVRGHWRHQPTNDGIKLVYIHPFIKGPEGKPLKPGAERVFAVTR